MAGAPARQQCHETTSQPVKPGGTCCNLCTQAGQRYDLQVVYRLCALLLSLSTDAAAMRVFASAFKELPSFKFVPLVYQVGGVGLGLGFTPTPSTLVYQVWGGGS